MTNLMKMHAASQGQSYAFSRIGWVKDFDPKTNCVKVGYFNIDTQHFDLMSGWLPIQSPAVGKGDDSEAGSGTSWGFVHPPNINDQVVVTSRNGDFTNGIVTGALFSDVVPPPQPDGELTQMGEFLWCHKTGTYVKFLNNGDIFIYTDHDYNLHVKHDGKVLVEGNLTIEVSGNAAMYVAGDTSLVGKGDVTAYAKNLTANVAGDATVQSDGDITARARGNLAAAVMGGTSVDSNSNISITSHLGMITLDALAGVNIIAREGNIISTAAGVIAGSEDTPLPPLAPVVVAPVPAAPDPPPLFTKGVTPPPPVPVPVPVPSGGLAEGGAPGVTNVLANNPTPSSVNLQWDGTA